MTTRRYYIVPALIEYGEGGKPVSCAPDLPEGTAFAGTPAVGRGCYALVSPADLNAPVVGVDVDVADLQGLDDAAFHAALPVEVPAGTTDAELEALATAVDLNPVPAAAMQRHRAGGV